MDKHDIKNAIAHTILLYSRIGFNDGYTSGLDEGHEKGHKEGLKEGLTDKASGRVITVSWFGKVL